MGFSVRAAVRGDVPAIASLLASSLAEDGFFEQLLPSGSERIGGAERFFAAYALTHLGRDRALDVACDERGEVVGVAVWTIRPAGRSSVVSRQTGLAFRYLRSIGVVRLVRAARLRRELEHRRPHGTHWWLSALAVAAPQRRHGVATELLGRRLTSIDAAGVTAYVEASTLAAQLVCDRFRFRAHASPGVAPGYPVQPMTREPSRTLRRYD